VVVPPQQEQRSEAPRSQKDVLTQEAAVKQEQKQEEAFSTPEFTKS